MDASQSDVALSRKEFNRNRKIVLRNVPGITIEVTKSTKVGCQFILLQSRFLPKGDGKMRNTEIGNG